MRYAIYWLPEKDTDFYHAGCHWFNQTDFFHTLIEKFKNELTYYDFSSAVNIPKKYGFHAELFPPFCLANNFSEYHIFELCLRVSKRVTKSDLKLILDADGNSLCLRPDYKSMLIVTVKQALKEVFSMITNQEDSFYYDDNFKMILSNTTDKIMHYNLHKIASLYWQDVLKKPVEIKHFSLCYQKEKHLDFQELMRFDFKIT